MKKSRHYLCLDEREFTVLFAECEVPSLLAYNSALTEFTQEDYNEGIFTLYKRELLQTAPDGQGFSLSEEIKEIINILKACNFVFTIDGAEELPEYCIYKKENYFLITTPGTRRNEYIKMMVVDGDGLVEFLDEGELFPEQIVLADIIFGKKDAHTGETLDQVAVRAGTIFDELHYMEGGEPVVDKYLKNEAINKVMELMGGSYGIS